MAWVESPLQMLCAVEAHHAGLVGDRLRVVSRARLPALAATRRELSRLALPPGVTLDAPRRVMSRPRGPATWVVGDAFSGRVQLRWLTSVPGRVVVVDDGMATLRLLELLAAGPYRPLLRARARPGGLRAALGLAAAIRLRAGGVTVFTALPVPPDLAAAVREAGVDLVRHEFAWLRGQPPAGPNPAERTVVLGTSLVRNGLVHRERYLRWVTELAAEEPLAYFPHRREDPVDVAIIRERPGITVHDGGAPAELTLRGLGPGQRVISLPSTAISSLRVLLGPRGVAVEPVEVPDDWWTSRAAPALRSHLTGVTG